ncbi:ABC transporter substrate-binding protein [Acidihalobacter prosperus]|uniref:ABC transporter substrate-binding protein n=1 Tax=Acidihalobacter prosperus TaxID=160660 RepID=A0A1A6C5B9_9GAMM|nr:ABC transporter substrate-binding protein [Acidihalobacter prosperus]OBS09744.1 ABC transporter substrate-binding protein [Acidihalobacter prosperus]
MSDTPRHRKSATTKPLSPERRDFLRASGVLGLGLASSGLALHPGSARAAEPPKRGGTLRVAVPAAKSIDPLKIDSAGAIAIVQQVGEYLVWAEPDLSLRPVLATAWHTPDGGKTWIFELRRGVRFHDGREMTADDVVATFERLVDPKQASVARAQIPFLKPGDTTKVDRHTVKFALDRPVGEFPYYTQIYNAIILPHDYAGDFAKHPVGTGPFRMVDYKPQQHARFERNPDYWDAGKPYLDAVHLGLYGSPQPMILALQGGGADMMLGISSIDAKPLLDKPDIRIARAHSSATRLLAMRVDRKPFDDRRVREAVALCLNREAMLEVLLGGAGELGNDHPVAPIFGDHIRLKQRRRDIAHAKQLLAQAGHPTGFDIDLYTGDYLELPQYAILAQQMLAPAGIRVKLHVEPLNTYYDHWTEVDFGLTDWTGRTTPSQILSAAFGGHSEWNAAHWKHPGFDKLVAELEATVDPRQRDRLANRAAAMLHDDVPAAIAYFIDLLRPMRRNVRGVEANMSQYLDLTRAWLA